MHQRKGKTGVIVQPDPKMRFRPFEKQLRIDPWKTPVFGFFCFMFSFEIIPYTLIFNFEAGTSRGILTEKKTWFIRLTHSDFPDREGWGECGPLPGLSPENLSSFEKDLSELSSWLLPRLNMEHRIWENLSPRWMEEWKGPWLPSAWFGWETAWLDWVNGGQKIICDPLFYAGQWKTPINGLVWMNPRQTMEAQAQEKRAEGFDTIKFKVGALDWQQELDMLREIRSKMPSSEIRIRLDANSAWKPDEALNKLEELSVLDIESIEQPIAPGQETAMKELCLSSPIPIALDEELMNKPLDRQKFSLLEMVEPPFIVLKPTLIGGMGQCNQWIKMAEEMGIGWWITSMLESNIGLNAVSQLASQYHPLIPQGLGTGKIYRNNPPSPLTVADGFIFSDPSKSWDLSALKNE
jgi:o-succinylbenzoate synthase